MLIADDLLAKAKALYAEFNRRKALETARSASLTVCGDACRTSVGDCRSMMVSRSLPAWIYMLMFNGSLACVNPSNG